jgi:pimeloyl-ACP methyl ester carboxylesterase
MKRGNSASTFLLTLAMVGALLVGVAAPTAAAATGATSGDFSGLVNIGRGRSIFVECRGHGSPTVVLISGQGNGARDWSQILDPADPVHGDPVDQISAGQGDIHDSGRAVFPRIARTTRVCAYDRPDTRTTGADRSTPRHQPHTVQTDVDDLRRMLRAIDAPKPYVLVAHSYGGFVAELYARTHPADVGGLVMVDAASSYLEHAVTPAKLQVWDGIHRTTSPGLPEGVEVLDALARLDAAAPLTQIPTVVLSADKPYPELPPGSGDPEASVTFADWIAAQNLLADGLGAEHVSATNSGHHVYLYSPQLVITAIRQVVSEVRTGPSSSPRSSNRCSSRRAGTGGTTAASTSSSSCS